MREPKVKIKVTPKVKDVRPGTALAYSFDFGIQLDKPLVGGEMVNGWQSMVTSLENTGKAFQLIQAEMPELKDITSAPLPHWALSIAAGWQAWWN